MSTRASLLLLCLLCTATSALAQSSSPVEKVIHAYREAIAAAESGVPPYGVESAFAAVEDLGKVLHASVPGATGSFMERLPDAAFARLQQLPGVFVRRHEVLVVRPVPRFFLALADRVGDEADRRFAAALAGTYRHVYWPVYLRPQTEYSGCTDFEAGELLETYLAWSAMQRDFPDRHVSAVAEERRRVVDEITRSTCACSGRTSVVAELARIAAGLTPPDPILEAVEGRLRALDGERPEFRFHCISG